MGEMTRMVKKTIRVLLVDDHPILRRGMRKILEKTSDIEVVGEAGDGREALELVQTKPADVLLLDIEMPEMDGLQVAQQIHENRLPIRILVLSAHESNQYILSTLKNGADGYLTKDEVPGVLVKAVRRVANGEKGLVSKRVHRRISSLMKETDLVSLSQ